MLLVAHRSPPCAVRCAGLRASGADVFELDLQAVGDEIVVSHFLPIVPALPRLRHDRWVVRWGSAAVGADRLAAAVDRLPAGSRILLDLKADGRAGVALAELVLRADLDRSRCFVSTPQWSVLPLLRRAGFRTWRTIAGRGALGEVLDGPVTADDGVTVRHRLLSPRLIGRLRQRTGTVIAWTVNSPARAAALAAAGVDGITSDRGEVFQLLRSRGWHRTPEPGAPPRAAAPAAADPPTTRPVTRPAIWPADRGAARRGPVWFARCHRADPGRRDRTGPPVGSGGGSPGGCRGSPMSDSRLARAQVLYEQAVFGGDAAAVDTADRELDALAADLALARGRVRHARFLRERAEDPHELELFEQAAQLYGRLGDARGEGEALFWVGTVHQVVRRDADRALPFFRRAQELATAAGDRLTLSYVVRHLGFVERAAGRYDAARELLEQSVRLRQEVGFAAGVAAGLLALAELAHQAGEPGDARRLLAEADVVAAASAAAGIRSWIDQTRTEFDRAE